MKLNPLTSKPCPVVIFVVIQIKYPHFGRETTICTLAEEDILCPSSIGFLKRPSMVCFSFSCSLCCIFQDSRFFHLFVWICSLFKKRNATTITIIAKGGAFLVQSIYRYTFVKMTAYLGYAVPQQFCVYFPLKLGVSCWLANSFLTGRTEKQTKEKFSKSQHSLYWDLLHHCCLTIKLTFHL